MFKYLFLFLAVCGLQTWAQAQSFTADRVVATVGNEIILWSEIEAQYMLMRDKSQGKTPENARCLIFGQLLANSLLLAQAERDSVLAKDEDVDAQIDSRIREILNYMGGDESQFKLYYGITPLDMKERMRDDMRKQLVVQKMQGQISQNLTITPREVQDFFARIPKDSLPYFNSEVELAEIVVKPKINAEEDAKARKTAEMVRTMILEDTSRFAELAYQYSNDRGSAERGGAIGVTRRGQLVPEYESAAYSMTKGEVSEVIKSEYGYHVIQLNERLGNNINTRHVLIRPLVTLEDEEAAARRLDSIRNLILRDTLTFDQAIQKYSEDETSKNRNGDVLNPQTGESIFETGDLDPEVYFATEKLKIGEMSEVMAFDIQGGGKQYRIIRLRNRTRPHVANLADDYSRISQAALEEKKARYLDTWVDKYIPRHSVQILWDAELEAWLGKCPNLEKWKTPKQ